MKNCFKCPHWPATQSHFILCNDNYLFSQGCLYPPQDSTTTHGPHHNTLKKNYMSLAGLGPILGFLSAEHN